MPTTTPSADLVSRIHLTLLEYPILKTRIRRRMRKELFERGIIQKDRFESEARKKALLSQEREGLSDPFKQEAADTWDIRMKRVRDGLTDFYFSYNLPFELFQEIIRELIEEKTGEQPDLAAFNPELAPQDMLFEQGNAIEEMTKSDRFHWEARLKEIKVVLIRTMISDQLSYIKIAKKWFNVSDLETIRRRRIGHGKIGGKAAGMLLAARILNETGDEAVKSSFKIPTSYYLGADVFNTFMSMNGLMAWADQKYKEEDQMRADFPRIQAEFMAGRFPDDIIDSIREVLHKAGSQPLIVRSSSLLEDNFGTSFAGKYDSYFCPNQGTPHENLVNFTNAIKKVYASGLNPEALQYRAQKELVDYDERIAILIQFVEGKQMGRYFLPDAAGVAFSRNLYRWSPQIRPESGFVRLVWGLGTRAVDQVGNDYPRLVALSHPELHPADSSKAIQHYSQRFVDLIDLEENSFKSMPVKDVINTRVPTLRYMAQVQEEGFLSPIRTNLVDPDKLVITFDGLLRRTGFGGLMYAILTLLEKHYKSPVDTEFALEMTDLQSLQPGVQITLLQCRPQSHLLEKDEGKIPKDMAQEDIIFSTPRMVPRGRVDDIQYVLFVSPKGYFSLKSPADRSKLIRTISKLNKALAGKVFISVGPGRWGTSTPDLGVHVAYGDIYNTRALVELSGKGIGSAPEPSFGTHFFQDLMEAQIYPLAIYLDDEDMVFHHDFFYQTPNHLEDFVGADADLKKSLRLIKVSDFRKKSHLNLVMNDDIGKAVAFLEKV
ncbi:PEP/pyruvate-binding domain-containing protein [Chloroflexota bacterium]